MPSRPACAGILLPECHGRVGLEHTALDVRGSRVTVQEGATDFILSAGASFLKKHEGQVQLSSCGGMSGAMQGPGKGPPSQGAGPRCPTGSVHDQDPRHGGLLLLCCLVAQGSEDEMAQSILGRLLGRG